MTASIILFVFLLPGMMFSYTLSSTSYFPTQGQYLSYVYNFNMTWDYTHFNMTIQSITKAETPPLKPIQNVSTSYGTVTTFYDIFYTTYFYPIIYVLNNFSVVNYGVTVINHGTNESITIPAIKFFNKGGSYMIVSAQYGFPISVYNATTENGEKFNFSVNLNFVKPSLNFVKSYTLYKITLYEGNGKNQTKVPVYVLSPSASFSFLNVNITGQLEGTLNISSNGYVTMILPLSSFPNNEPEGTIYVNGTPYYLILEQNLINGYLYYATKYASTSVPFMGAMIGHYYVLFFPFGGKISLVFYQGQINNIHVMVMDKYPSYSLLQFIPYIGLGVVAILVIVFFIRKKFLMK